MRIEGVSGEVLPRREQAEFFARDNPMQVAFLRADRTIALRDASGRAFDFEGDAPVMTSAAHDCNGIVVIRHAINLAESRAVRNAAGTRDARIALQESLPHPGAGMIFRWT
jgi:hypothetical protein